MGSLKEAIVEYSIDNHCPKSEFLLEKFDDIWELSWQIADEITPRRIIDKLNDPRQLSHGGDHYQRVANYFVLTALKTPEIVQLTDDNFESLLLAGLIACQVHDNVQVDYFSKIAHAELQALETFFQLHQVQEQFKLTDEEIYLTTACIYNHTFVNSLRAAENNYLLPPIEQIWAEADEILSSKLNSWGILESRPTFAEIGKNIKNGNYPDYPAEIEEKLVALASERMMIADEMDVMIPPQESLIYRVVAYDSQRPFCVAFALDDVGRELDRRLKLNGEEAMDDVTRVLIEASRFASFRQIGMKSFESALISYFEKKRLEALLQLAWVLAGNKEDKIAWIDTIYDRQVRSVMDEAEAENKSYREALEVLAEERKQMIIYLTADSKKISPDRAQGIEKMVDKALKRLELTGPQMGTGFLKTVLKNMPYKFIDWQN